MSLFDFLVLLVIAAIVGFIAQSLGRYRGGGVLVTIAIGFVGALFGGWIARRLGLPELLAINVGGVNFPIIWAIIGAVLFVSIVSLSQGGGGNRWGITPPTRVVLILSVILAALSLLMLLGLISVPVSTYALMAAAYFVLLFGNLVKGL